MHVLLLSQNFPPEIGSAAAKMQEIADYLIAKNHQVSVVSQIPCYPPGMSYPGYEGAWFRRELINGIRVTRTWSYAPSRRDRFWPVFRNFTSFMGTALVGILSGPRPDVIYVYSPPLFLGLTAAIASKFWRCPFVFWVNDLYPRAALFLGYMKDDIFYRLACAMEKFIYGQAAKIFVYSRHMGDEVIRDGAIPDKIEVHPLWIDPLLFHPNQAGATEVRQQFGWEGKFVILYGGNIGMVQGLDVLLASAQQLRQYNDILFALVGTGVDKPRLMEQARNKNLSNVVFIDHQPKEKVSAFFSAADLLFAHLKAAPHRIGTVPEKILAYMGCGRPVLLAVQEGAASDIIQTYNCGQVVPPENPEALSQAILSLYNNRHQIDPMGVKAREAVESSFSASNILRAMEVSLTAISKG